MSKPQQSPGPSMEELLASIRHAIHHGPEPQSPVPLRVAEAAESAVRAPHPAPPDIAAEPAPPPPPPPQSRPRLSPLSPASADPALPMPEWGAPTGSMRELRVSLQPGRQGAGGVASRTEDFLALRDRLAGLSSERRREPSRPFTGLLGGDARIEEENARRQAGLPVREAVKSPGLAAALRETGAGPQRRPFDARMERYEPDYLVRAPAQAEPEPAPGLQEPSGPRAGWEAEPAHDARADAYYSTAGEEAEGQPWDPAAAQPYEAAALAFPLEPAAAPAPYEPAPGSPGPLPLDGYQALPAATAPVAAAAPAEPQPVYQTDLPPRPQIPYAPPPAPAVPARPQGPAAASAPAVLAPELISEDASAVTAAAFNRLADAILAQGASGDAPAVQITRDMLKPMLKAWLDQNLPTIVERIVREEIERVARRGGR